MDRYAVSGEGLNSALECGASRRSSDLVQQGHRLGMELGAEPHVKVASERSEGDGCKRDYGQPGPKAARLNREVRMVYAKLGWAG